MEIDFYRWGVGPRDAVKQERGRKGLNLQSGDSPLHRLFCGPPSSALPLLPAPHGQMLPGGPPQPRHQTNGCQGAHGRSPAWSKEPVLLGPRRHPSLCRARSWNPAPAPSSQVPGSRPAWPWTLLSHTHIWSVEGPWGLCLQNISQLWSLLTATTQRPAIISASVTATAHRPPCLCPCSPRSVPAQRLERTLSNTSDLVAPPL